MHWLARPAAAPMPAGPRIDAGGRRPARRAGPGGPRERGVQTWSAGREAPLRILQESRSRIGSFKTTTDGVWRTRPGGGGSCVEECPGTRNEQRELIDGRVFEIRD